MDDFIRFYLSTDSSFALPTHAVFLRLEHVVLSRYHPQRVAATVFTLAFANIGIGVFCEDFFCAAVLVYLSLQSHGAGMDIVPGLDVRLQSCIYLDVPPSDVLL